MESLLASALICPARETGEWLKEQGCELLSERAREVEGLLREPGLLQRIETELEASRAGGSKVFRIGNSLRILHEEIMLLVLAHQLKIPIADAIWQTAREVIQFTLRLGSLAFDAQNQNPPWKADLWTADIGVSLAFNAHWDSPLNPDRPAIARFLKEKCTDAIRADWISPATRVHSLDTMGHNWWSVMVGGAAIVEALLGNREKALELVAAMDEWFQYPGNAGWRKQPNFGQEGDYLEGFTYGEYALFRPLELAFLLPEWQVTTRWLSRGQCEGLAEWYRHAFVRTKEGSWWPQRFGDIPLAYQIRAEVWHPLSRLANDTSFLQLAHELKPRPVSAFEFLMWQPTEPLVASESSPHQDRQVFPVSGMAFLGNKNLSLTARAGDFWNHNHLDCGSFIFQQNGVIWADDAGTCRYSTPEYTKYYSSPAAHNVAYAPALAPENNTRAQVEGMPVTGSLRQYGKARSLEVLLTETLPLSGGALARSHRWFLVLEEEAVVVWDDLESYQPQYFESLLHTACSVEETATAQEIVLRQSEETCQLSFFADSPVEFSNQVALLGDVCKADAYYHGEPNGSLEGRCLRWRTAQPVLRQKFGLLMGGTHSNAHWQTSDSGWELSVQIANARWSLWLNRRADGSVMHKNSINTWREIETDAYALISKKHSGQETLYSLQSSFVRRKGHVLHSSLRRAGLVEIPLTD